MVARIQTKVCVLFVSVTIALLVHADAQTTESPFPDSVEESTTDNANVVTNLIGGLLKAVAYGGTGALSAATPLVCPLVRRTSQEIPQEPAYFIFNNPDDLNDSLRINANDTVSRELLARANFDVNQVTVILTHGAFQGIDLGIALRAAKNVALGANGDGSANAQGATKAKPNVIIVDWPEFANSLLSSGENAKIVASRLATFLRQLVSLVGLKPELMHCIGHSYGAHLCGQAAREAFPTNTSSLVRMGRITALDPGGLCYELGARDEDTYAGLRPSDALLVDAYGTNMGLFGTRSLDAQYNVIINNGVVQSACSLVQTPDLASAYFRDTIGFLLGNPSNIQTVGCDHFFPTRLTYQQLPPTCSYLGYRCESYEHYVRGRCAQCSNVQQCYSMNTEYQRPNPSVSHFREKIERSSSYFNDFTGDEGSSGSNSSELRGSVAYNDRRAYHMKASIDAPYCSVSYRVRVRLSDGTSINSNQLKLQFLDEQGQVMDVVPATSDRNATDVSVYGPWTATNGENYGLDGNTLTALFQLGSSAAARLLSVTNADQLDGSPIKSVVATYDYGLLYNRLSSNPIESISLDYVSVSDPSVRAQLSTSFSQGQFTVVYKYLGATVGQDS